MKEEREQVMFVNYHGVIWGQFVTGSKGDQL